MVITLQTILGILKFGQPSLEDAVETPRIYAPWNKSIRSFDVILEQDASNHSIQEEGNLTDVYKQNIMPVWRMYKSVVESIYIDSDNRKYAVSDPRKGGTPAGVKKRSLT